MSPFVSGFFHLMFSVFIHVVACISTSFFFCLNNAPFYGNTFFVYPFVGGWTFGLFPFLGGLLWILLLWTFTYKFLCAHIFSVLLYMYPRVELLGHMGNSLFNFLRNWYWFPKWKQFMLCYHFTFPPAVCEGSRFPTSLPTHTCLFNNSHPGRCVNGLFAFLLLICKSSLYCGY